MSLSLPHCNEEWPRHRPRLPDLRDSGSIEQEADMVMFIHRSEGQNGFNLRGSRATLGSRPHIIATRRDAATIIGVKTGNPRPSVQWASSSGGAFRRPGRRAGPQGGHPNGSGEQ